MQFTHTNWFHHVCRVVLFTFSCSLFHPTSLGVPSGIDLKLRISDAGALILDFGPWTLDLGPSSAYGQAQDPNLASTPEANTADPFIVQKAAELGRDPQRIFAFVSNEIGYEAYQGSLRGARGTLWSKAGNALDQASLLIALLRASNIPARYVKGTLGTSEAQQLILSMFPPVLRIVGCPPADALKADPVNDPKLLAEAKEHYWVEYGSSFTPADPTYPDAVIGQTFASAQGTFSEVPDNLRHKVTVRLKAEQSTAFSNGQMQTVLNQTFITAFLVGRPLSIGHFVNSKAAGGLVGSTVTHTYSPYILVGENDGNIEDDEIIRGTDYQELLSTLFSIGNKVLTGVFLEMDVRSPDGKVETYDRAILDRIGFVARQNGRSTTINFSGMSAEQSAFSELDIVTLSAMPSLQETKAHEAVLPSFELKAIRAQDLLSLMRGIDFSNPTNQTKDTLQQASAFLRATNTEFSALVNSLYFRTSDVFNDALMQVTSTKAYANGAKIILSKLQIKEVNGAPISILSLDLVANGVRAIAKPNQIAAAAQFYNFTRGFLENGIEGQIVDSLTPGSSGSITALRIFEEAARQGIELRTITPANSQAVDSLHISEEAKARISFAVNKGMSVIVPSQGVEVGASSITGWFEINPANGHTQDRLENGEGAALFENLVSFFGLSVPLARSLAFALGVVTPSLVSVD